LGASAEQIIRRQETAVSLTSDGQLEQAPLHHVKISEHNQDASLPRMQPEIANALMDRTTELCDVDFPLGTPDTVNCSDTRHQLILDDGDCIKAAVDSLATIDEHTFRIHWTLKDDKPQGCFVEECAKGVHPDGSIADASATGECFFYNEVSYVPTGSVQGTPVCTRPKYQKGTVNTNGLGQDCPPGYSVVRDEDKCETTALCLAHAHGDFQVEKNNSIHDEHPQGCFVDAVDGKAYFNPAVMGFGEPQAPVGTPLCNVSSFTKCHGADDGSHKCSAMDSTLLFDRAGHPVKSLRNVTEHQVAIGAVDKARQDAAL